MALITSLKEVQPLNPEPIIWAANNRPLKSFLNYQIITMKKILFLSLFATLCFASQAQVALKSQYGNAIDTVDNTGTKYLTLQNSSLTATPITSFYKVASVAVGVTEITGTTAGTITVQASLDNTVWYDVYSSISNTGATYSFAPADVTTLQAYRFRINSWSDRYLRIKYVGAGTMSAAFTAKVSFFN